MKINKTLFFFVLMLLNFSCSNSESTYLANTKFNKTEWQKYNSTNRGLLIDQRNCMLNDLIKNETLVGLTYDSLISTLGIPEKYSTQWRASYFVKDISDPFALGIDPVSEKKLIFDLNFDTVMKEYKVVAFHLDTLKH